MDLGGPILNCPSAAFTIQRAKEEMDRWHIKLADPDLAFLPEDSEHFRGYWHAVSWAQDYAMTNRTLMMEHAKAAVSKAIGLPVLTTEHAVNCHHNYVAVENHFGKNVYVTRKGAVRAREGDMGIIPGSMGPGALSCAGKAIQSRSAHARTALAER